MNKEDGKILWQNESSWKDIVPTEKEKEQIEEERKQDDELKKEQSNLEKESSVLRKAIREEPATKAENEAKLQRLEAQIDKTRARRKAFLTLNRYREPGKDAGGYHPTGGYSSATPVTDGKHVYLRRIRGRKMLGAVIGGPFDRGRDLIRARNSLQTTRRGDNL